MPQLRLGFCTESDSGSKGHYELMVRQRCVYYLCPPLPGCYGHLPPGLSGHLATAALPGDGHGAAASREPGDLPLQLLGLAEQLVASALELLDPLHS